MNKAIEFAKAIADVPDEDLSVIMQSRKTLLFSKKKKKGSKILMYQWDATTVQKFANP